jgi:hypothetical protein
MDAGTETGAIYLIEEGSVAMQKDVKVTPRQALLSSGHSGSLTRAHRAGPRGSRIPWQ